LPARKKSATSRRYEFGSDHRKGRSMTKPSTVQQPGRVVIKDQAPCGIMKGPFFCHETLYQDELGDEKILLHVDLLERGVTKDWPRKRLLPTPVLDHENLPMLCWREFDTAPYTRANAGINHAPRACFIWRSSFDNQPPQFVSVSMDYRLPAFLTNGSIFGGAALLYVIGCALYVAHRWLSADYGCAGWDCGSWVLESALGQIKNVTLLIGGGLAGFLLVMKTLGVSMRSALLITPLVARIIWHGYKFGRRHPLIAPWANAVPWTSLEGFEIKRDPKDPDDRDSIERTRIRASFGLAAPEIDVLNGTLNEDAAREMLRRLTAIFLEKRPHYLAQLEEGVPPLTPKAEHVQVTSRCKHLIEKFNECFKSSAQLTRQAGRLEKNPRRTAEAEELKAKARQLDDEAGQLSAEIEPLVARIVELEAGNHDLYSRFSRHRVRST
jgi:hypothetical protein